MTLSAENDSLFLSPENLKNPNPSAIFGRARGILENGVEWVLVFKVGLLKRIN